MHLLLTIFFIASSFAIIPSTVTDNTLKAVKSSLLNSQDQTTGGFFGTNGNPDLESTLLYSVALSKLGAKPQKDICDFIVAQSSSLESIQDKSIFVQLGVFCPSALTPSLKTSIAEDATSILKASKSPISKVYYATKALSALGKSIDPKSKSISRLSSIFPKSVLGWAYAPILLSSSSSLSSSDNKNLETLLNQFSGPMFVDSHDQDNSFEYFGFFKPNTRSHAIHERFFSTIASLEGFAKNGFKNLNKDIISGLQNSFSRGLEQSHDPVVQAWSVIGYDLLKDKIENSVSVSENKLEFSSNIKTLEISKVLLNGQEIDSNLVSLSGSGKSWVFSVDKSLTPGIVSCVAKTGKDYVTFSTTITDTIKISKCTLKSGDTIVSCGKSKKVSIQKADVLKIDFDASFSSSKTPPSYVAVQVTHSLSKRVRTFLINQDGTKFTALLDTLKFFPESSGVDLVAGLSRKSHSDQERNRRATKALAQSIPWSYPLMRIRHIFFGDEGDQTHSQLNGKTPIDFTLEIIAIDSFASNSGAFPVGTSKVVCSSEFVRHGLPQDMSKGDPLDRHLKDVFFDANTAVPMFSIHHIFRSDVQRKHVIISYVAAVAVTVLPLFVLSYSWLKTGINMSNFSYYATFSVLSLPMVFCFLSSFGLVFGLYFIYWYQLNMFQTLGYLSVLLLVVIISGYNTLSVRSAIREQK